MAPHRERQLTTTSPLMGVETKYLWLAEPPERNELVNYPSVDVEAPIIHRSIGVHCLICFNFVASWHHQLHHLLESECLLCWPSLDYLGSDLKA